ncbi:AzlC family ABC transporter permease [Rhodoferax sp. U11-2br]|uniref:AzlC family ABC transporter permease n=1 Tax=Rhodoferax sp. U11-2br TaxID=2838878 RepID=UPI001BEBA13F|nr:AzlC family ABC transporter permease [Rhodoferax sp. U11-2br]
MFLKPSLFRHPEFRVGVMDALGAAPGLAAWALMTGVAMVNSGLSTFESLLMGLIVFAGSSQLAAIPLIAAGAPAWVVLATGWCVNLRFVVFSAHMRPYLMHLPLRERLLTGYLLTDLSYVQFTRRYPQHGSSPEQLQAQQAYLAGNCGLSWASWESFTVLGIVLAGLIPASWGLGFAGILALLGVLLSLASGPLRWVSAGVAGAAAVAAFALPFKLNILVAIAAAVAMSLMLEAAQRAKNTRVETTP